MPKLKYSELKKSIECENLDNRRFYETKYYGIFLNAFDFPELNQEQQHYLLKRFWKDGCVNAFVLEGSKPDKTLKGLIGNKSVSSITMGEENDNGLLVFTPFSVMQWNIYDFPTIINPINVRGAGFIQYKPMIVNKDCVIGYAHTTHTSIRALVRFYIEKICDVENTISTNLFVHKLPRLVVVSPEDRRRVEDLVEKIEAGEHKLFLDAEDYQAIKQVLESGGTYIIDKLYQYKQALENELLTLLGVDNIGVEKRERLIVDEANSNNDLINDNGDCFLDTLKFFCKQVSEILGYPLSVKAKASPVVSESSDMMNKQDEGGKEDVE